MCQLEEGTPLPDVGQWGGRLSPVATSIHPTAIVEPGAKIGQDVTIGEYSVIRSGVSLGDRSRVGAFCEIGFRNNLDDRDSTLSVGEGAEIRSHSVLYSGSSFGNNLTTGHRVTVRSGTTAGEALHIGTGTDIQGKCKIHDFVRMHSNVHVSMMSEIESFVWLYPGVVLTNDPRPPSEILLGVHIEEFAVVAVGATVLPGIRVGRGALIGAGSILTRDADPDSLYSGNPARKLGPLSNLRLQGPGTPAAYPWRFRFSRGYPEDVARNWGSALGN